MNSTQQINKEQYEDEIVVYTPKEIGKILKLGKNRAYELMNSKTFPSYRINNKLLVTKKDLCVWLKSIKGKQTYTWNNHK